MLNPDHFKKEPDALGHDAPRGELIELAREATQMGEEANRWARRAAATALGAFLAATIALGVALGGG